MVSRRFLWLCARTRAPRALLGSLLAVSALSWLTVGAHRGELFGLFVVVFLPMIPAAAIGLGLYSPIRALERTFPRPVAHLDLVRAVVSLFAAALAVIIPVATQTGRIPWDLLTNLLGYVGLVLVWSALVDGRLAWLPVVSYGFATYVSLLQNPDSILALTERPCLWPVLPANAPWAVAAELVLLTVGLVAFILLRHVRARPA